MSELTTLARPYAKAAFEYAQANDGLSAWSDMLLFCAAAVQDPTLAHYLDNPGMTRKEAATVMLKVAEGKLDAKGENFIHLLAENKRLNLLPAICELYEEHKAAFEKTIDVDITSAVELNADQQSKVSERLTAKLGRQVNIKVETDTSLIGGMIIRAGDTVIDASIRGKLNDLSDAMKLK